MTKISHAKIKCATSIPS
jgi:hypothetical protein